MKGNDRIIFAIGSAALALLVYSIFPEIGLTYDSDLYLKLARNLSTQGFDQQSFGSKPPLYPILLWMLQGDPLVISLFNLTCWIASMILTFKIFAPRIKDEFLKIAFSTVLIFATPIMMVHNFVWTEPFFILLTLNFLVLIEKEQTLRNWIFQALILVGMVSLKHLGIALIFGFGVVTLLKNRDLKKAFIIYTPSIVFFILWQYKSYLIRGDFSRLDHTTDLNLYQNLEWIGQTFLHWFEPFSIPGLFSILVAISASVTLLLHFWKADTTTRYFLSIPLSIITVLITKADLLEADMERYLSVAFSPLLFFIFLKLSQCSWSRKWFLKIPVLLFVAYSIIRAIKNGVLWH